MAEFTSENRSSQKESLHLPPLIFRSKLAVSFREGISIDLYMSLHVFFFRSWHCSRRFTPRVPAALAGKIPLSSASQSLIHLPEMCKFQTATVTTGIPRRRNAMKRKPHKFISKRLTDSLTKNLILTKKTSKKKQCRVAMFFRTARRRGKGKAFLKRWGDLLTYPNRERNLWDNPEKTPMGSWPYTCGSFILPLCHYAACCKFQRFLHDFLKFLGDFVATPSRCSSSLEQFFLRNPSVSVVTPNITYLNDFWWVFPGLNCRERRDHAAAHHSNPQSNPHLDSPAFHASQPALSC